MEFEYYTSTHLSSSFEYERKPPIRITLLPVGEVIIQASLTLKGSSGPKILSNMGSYFNNMPFVVIHFSFHEVLFHNLPYFHFGSGEETSKISTERRPRFGAVMMVTPPAATMIVFPCKLIFAQECASLG